MNREPDLVLNNIRILYLGKDKKFYTELMNIMKSGVKEWGWSLTEADSYEAAAAHFHRDQYDVCLVDEKTGEKNGMETMSSFEDQGLSVPMIFLSGNFHLQTLERALHLGASDCLPKNDLNWTMLFRSIFYAVHVHREKGRRHAAEDELDRASNQNEQLLSSVTSILVGIQGNGFINHWNAVAENTFGIRADQILGQSLNECSITWEAYRIFRSE